MVPVVVVMGTLAFGGGAIINNNQKNANQHDAKETKQAAQSQAAEQPAAILGEPEQTVEQETEERQAEQQPQVVPAEDGVATSGSDESAVSINPAITENDDGTVTIRASLSTLQKGHCAIVINDTQFSAVAEDGVCEFKNVSVPVDKTSLNITFEAENTPQTGSTSTEVN